MVEQVAPSRASVLIHGETGTGKELIAEMIHRASPRAKAPLVRLNCAALSESLLESELFGHERGRSRGPSRDARGDSSKPTAGPCSSMRVREIPLATQVKLLRFLQERNLRAGRGQRDSRSTYESSRRPTAIGDEASAKGRSAKISYYRLNVVMLELPPLRERVTDIAELASFFLRRYAAENGKAIDAFAEDALRARSSIDGQATCASSRTPSSGPWSLRRVAGREKALAAHRRALGGERRAAAIPGLTIAELERYAILKTLEACAGLTSRAATVLGVSPRKIQYKLHEYEGPEHNSATAEREEKQG